MPTIPCLRQTQDLKSQAEDLVKRLGGIWLPGGAMCRCPAHDDRTPSLSVRIGEKALRLKCFAGCDTIDVIRAIRRLEIRVPSGSLRASIPSATEASPGWLRRRALDLWDQARPITGTPAEIYLQRRAIKPLSPALRYHPRTPLGGGKLAVFRPALISALHERSRLVALQRTFLDAHEPRRARDLANPRRMLGLPGRGAVVLAPATQTLGLAEGIETALSAIALLGIPVWATLGSERLARIAIPDTVTRLILLPDNDRGGRIGAAKAAQAHTMPGRTIETLWPPQGFNDWNDVLRAKRKGVGDRTRQAA
ncbi:DNA primase [Novosphingobium endophyticum]|uniref:DNA primase n=1 Tax=Novosphingobium endophyticum TaxID=1955250 RepID=A0A916X7B7_9SPHN|nr:toprim domain-containing protein [Novosphingobium endophyticum]GGC16118.1 DNA primase [Novosphingobium endophyticum]